VSISRDIQYYLVALGISGYGSYDAVYIS